MDRSVAFVLSLSILIPLIIGIIRYRQLPVSYLPLFYLLVFGLLTELVSYTLFYNSSNAFPNNIYVLVEFLLLVWQFRSWKNILRNDWLHKCLVGAVCLLWLSQNFVFGTINQFSALYEVSYSVILILLAVNQMNWLIVNEKTNILFNAIFLICIAIMVFFSYKVLMEIFYYYAPERMIKNNIFSIQSYMNVGYNIILAVAILCIPPKKNFIQPSR